LLYKEGDKHDNNPIQSNPIQSNPIQSNPIQSNPADYVAIQPFCQPLKQAFHVFVRRLFISGLKVR